MLVKLLAAAALLLSLYTFWRGFEVRPLYHELTQAPQGQAVGPATAKTTIVEFMDYRCTPCRSLGKVMDEVARRHPEARIVFSYVPTEGQASDLTARMALAAGKQGRFKPMHDALLARAEAVTDKDLPALCQQAAVDCARLRQDMAAPDIEATLKRTWQLSGRIGVRATPTFLVGRRIFSSERGLPTPANFDAILAAQGAGG